MPRDVTGVKIRPYFIHTIIIEFIVGKERVHIKNSFHSFLYIIDLMNCNTQIMLP